MGVDAEAEGAPICLLPLKAASSIMTHLQLTR